MSSASKPDKHYQCDSNEGTPRAKGGKLARRARSFKEDFLDILAQMRSPVGVRAGSPKPSPKHRTTSGSEAPPERERDPLNDLNLHVRQVQLALNHFSEVASNNKMEVLPNNGTVVLEIVTTIHSLLKTYVFIDQSSALVSATNQVYQSVARLIRLCDDVLLQGDKAITKESVTEVVKLVQDAVKNLVALASAKITEQNSKLVSAAKPEHRDHGLTSVCSLDLPRSNTSRASLPEIPLTQREREILEQTTAVALRRMPHHSLSSESVLHDDNPPPKPPLPHRIWTNESPPPLPPKKRMAPPPVLLDDRTSLTSSMGSVDSMLNDNSSLRDDDELQALVDDDSSVNLESTQNDHGASGSLLNGSASCYCWDGSCSTLSREQNQDSPDLAPPAYTVVAERISSSSGFVSLRSSSQSYNYTSKSETKNLSEVKSISETKMQTQTLSVQRSSVTSSSGESQSSIITHNLSGAQSSVTLQNSDMSSVPPKLPVKQRSRRERLPSQYDNVPTSRDSSPTLPPPLPLKKKHIMAYMEMFGNCSQPNTSEYMRHSVHTYSMLQREWQQDEVTLNTTHSSFNLITHHSTPSPEMRGVSPQSPLAQQSGEEAPPALPPKQRSERQTVRPHSDPPPPKETDVSAVVAPLTPTLPVAPPVLLVPANAPSLVIPTAPAPASISPLELLDVAHLLVFKKPEEEGPDIRGGHPDALLILATKANKNDFLYQEAFLTTYRTFISPLELIEKLCRRHERFSRSKDVAKQRAAREAFSLLVRVVSDLTMNDFNQAVVQTLTDFVYQLLCRGDLIMAKALRVKILDKHDTKRLHNATCNLLSSQNVYTRQSSLLDFKSEHMAEQMTLLDSELFKKIEIPEVLIWAQEQNEERSPNLTRFTEHFNKMSYWARSRILEQSDAKDREKYVVRFIKIMKHLRKINNFNSYLALLSALDSAPIRRLEWQKHITEGLKEYCALIDSSSSFRAYRQALAETQPPCIPYIGLVLQDLTFVHIGNSDFLLENVINFSKRWQQYNIVENMKRFKKGTYDFEKRERIIAFFSNFDEFLCEEAMWQISESIKPRGTKKAIR